MTKKFDLLRYKELLELEPSKKDFTDDTFNEFLDYKALILSQVLYNRKEEYFIDVI